MKRVWGPSLCLSVLHRESFHNKPRQRSHSEIFVHTLCAFEPQPQWSVSQQQIAGPAEMAGVATIQKCIGTLYSYGGS